MKRHGLNIGMFRKREGGIGQGILSEAKSFSKSAGRINGNDGNPLPLLSQCNGEGRRQCGFHNTTSTTEYMNVRHDHTHFAWPQHEAPWDFWRFTDGGLKVLFSGAMGFEVISAGMFEPLHMYLDHPGVGQETFPEFPAYGGSVVMARKVAEVGTARGAWDVDVAEVCEGTAYPHRGR